MRRGRREVVLGPEGFVEADLGGEQGACADKVVPALVPPSTLMLVVPSELAELEVARNGRRRGGEGRGESPEEEPPPRAAVDDCGGAALVPLDVGETSIASSNSAENA